MAQNKKVFLATDVVVAFIDRSHPKHLHAVAFFRYFAQEGYILFTNVSNIIAIYNNLYKNISPSLGRDFLRALSLSNINIIYPEDSDFKLAVKTLTNYQSTELHLDEALMAAIASKRSIPSICTLGYLHPLFGLTVFYLPI
jgi:predicted nucleic acid-binding protein